MKTLSPGATIGILGGGQLGRMLAMAASRLGFSCIILDPDRNCPAGKIARAMICADYDDETALAALSAECDVITYEFENVPAHAVAFLQAAGSALAPPPKALEISQDRLREKNFLQDIGIATAPYQPVENEARLRTAIEKLGLPALLKTRRLGYDGKGQAIIKNQNDITNGWKAMQSAPAILEGFIDFALEISVITVRGADGNSKTYHPARNIHKGGILRRSIVPSGADAPIITEARTIAMKIANALDYIGVLGIEFFVGKDDSLMVNEFAPRVHNSGHWTVEACGISQFENHIRAITGWPLGDTARHSNCEMENLIGEDAANWQALAEEQGALLTLYGKRHQRPGRKMGHVTRLKPL